ncbi:flagellin [Polymorphum gilvum]|uniref:Flagellin n=1 Tax=Polymorphum gilvum (strain LMG 25793 / CGMCC 1.9160 / SL003B-26A1) TaxID=991905 RepID=F2J621_POLGS|nr:flagellin [Polymorphum gilvum]ADZ72385.1 Flagellin-like protein [Polymorphum gilvum SL003B-26A1]
MPVISTNTAANTAVRYLNSNSTDQSDSLAKLASGSRITKASDDAAGLAISTKIRSDVAVLEQASTNASNAISILQTADGGAARISDILERMKVLAAQSSSGTVTDSERVYIDAEFQQLIEEIDGIAQSTRYNGDSLLESTSAATAGLSVVVGTDVSDTISLTTYALDATSIGVNALDLASATNADAAMTALDTAIDSVSAARAKMGATMSRFEFRSEAIATSMENLDAAQSAIADVDIAAEQARLSATSVKVQAAVAAAAQANEMPQNLLKLLQ